VEDRSACRRHQDLMYYHQQPEFDGKIISFKRGKNIDNVCLLVAKENPGHFAERAVPNYAWNVFPCFTLDHKNELVFYFLFYIMLFLFILYCFFSFNNTFMYLPSLHCSVTFSFITIDLICSQRPHMRTLFSKKSY
jgi:hypothetical protein